MIVSPILSEIFTARRELHTMEACTDKLRHLIEGALDEAQRLQDEIEPCSQDERTHDAHETLGDLIDYLNTDIFDLLVKAEKAHKEWTRKEYEDA